MRVLMMLKSDEVSETGAMPEGVDMNAMQELMEDMAKAGILLAAEGLKPSSAGKRVKIAGGKVVSVTDGPFAEAKELIGGYCLVKVDSWEELEPWTARFAAIENDREVEFRPLYEAEDFLSEDFTAEDVARENALRTSLAALQS